MPGIPREILPTFEFAALCAAEWEKLSGVKCLRILALAQIFVQDTCRALPSITNLLAENCGTKSGSLTENDIAFLRGLYKMSPAMMPGTQKDEISYQMEQALKGR